MLCALLIAGNALAQDGMAERSIRGPAAANAQDFPSKPIRFIVLLGGASDTLAREIGPKLTELWGQQIVIDNRPGAGGTIGAAQAAKATPDGYTIVMNFIGSLAIAPHLYRDLPYDPVKDFAPVSLVATSPLILVSHPSFPARSVQEFIQFAKSKPGQLNFASPGTGTGPHLAGELFKYSTGINMMHVPYKTGPQSITAVISGEVQLIFTNIPQALPHIRTGRVTALAITSARRSALIPAIPTVAEAGVSGYEVSPWWGVSAPAGTPKQIVARLNAGIVGTLGKPEVQQRLLSMGFEPAGGTPEQFSAYIKSELIKWAKVVKESGARVE